MSEQSLINAIKEIMDRKYGKGNVIFESKGEVMLLSEMLLSLKPGAGAKLQLTVENDIFSGTYYKRDSNAFDQQTANQFVRNSKAKLLYAKTGKQTTTK